MVFIYRFSFFYFTCPCADIVLGVRAALCSGPPLDVWSMGIILFAVLKRPRDAIIKSRIIRGQFKIDDNLSADAKVCFLSVCVVSSVEIVTDHVFAFVRDLGLGFGQQDASSGPLRAGVHTGNLQPLMDSIYEQLLSLLGVAPQTCSVHISSCWRSSCQYYAECQSWRTLLFTNQPQARDAAHCCPTGQF